MKKRKDVYFSPFYIKLNLLRKKKPNVFNSNDNLNSQLNSQEIVVNDEEEKLFVDAYHRLVYALWIHHYGYFKKGKTVSLLLDDCVWYDRHIAFFPE